MRRLFRILAEILAWGCISTGPSAWGASEQLQGFVTGLSAWNSSLNSGVVAGQSCDFGNKTTAVTVQGAWDDSTFATNTFTLASGLTCNGTSQWTKDITGIVGSVNPQDGTAHRLYAQVLSNAAGPNFLLIGGGYPATISSGIDQGYPYTFTGGAVAPRYVPTIMLAGQRLTASQHGIITNSNDPYSIGSNTGGATKLCDVAVCGANIYSNGSAGYWANKWSVPFDANHWCDAPVTVSVAIAVASAGPFNTCRAKFAGLTGKPIQAIALAFVQPSEVHGTTFDMSISGYIGLGSFPGGLPGGASNAYFCPAGAFASLGYSVANPFLNKLSATPFTDTNVFPTMMLVGEVNGGSDTFSGPWTADVPTFSSMVDAAFAAKDGNPSGTVYTQYTADAGRRSLSQVTPATATLTNATFTKIGTLASPITCPAFTSTNILIYVGGCPTMPTGATESYVAGLGISYNVTSVSGKLPYDGSPGVGTQTPIAYQLGRGAIAAYGNAVEPCGSLPQKYPDPLLLFGLWRQGPTVLQALVGSMVLPWWAGNFAGDPMATLAPEPATPTGGTAFSGAISFPGAVVIH